MYRDKDITEVLYAKSGHAPLLVDLRSPGEYRESTIPGALNVPLLDNVERSLVGIAYKQDGPGKARELAMEIVAPRLPQFIYDFKNIAPDRVVTVFCWRGGERSHFAGCILDAVGFKVNRVRGGIKAYRRHVLKYFCRELPHRAVVVYGLTGVGKTDLLLKLKDRGFPVLDLEGLAAHRGSVFGKIGQPPSPGQKMFEALIEYNLRRAEKNGFFLVECESRRLGNLFVPGSILQAMHNGYRFLAYAPLRVRVERIKRAYINGIAGSSSAFRDAVARLTKYIGKNRVVELNKWLDDGEFDKVVEFLLEHYYDPLYKYPSCPHENYDLSVNMENVEEAARVIGSRLNSLLGHQGPGR